MLTYLNVCITYLLRKSSLCLTYRSSIRSHYAVIFMDAQIVGPLGRMSTYITALYIAYSYTCLKLISNVDLLIVHQRTCWIFHTSRSVTWPLKYNEWIILHHGLTILYLLHQCTPCISRDSSCSSDLRLVSRLGDGGKMKHGAKWNSAIFQTMMPYMTFLTQTECAFWNPPWYKKGSAKTEQS